jgi:hypothetical protein
MQSGRDADGDAAIELLRDRASPRSQARSTRSTSSRAMVTSRPSSACASLELAYRR